MARRPGSSSPPAPPDMAASLDEPPQPNGHLDAQNFWTEGMDGRSNEQMTRSVASKEVRKEGDGGRGRWMSDPPTRSRRRGARDRHPLAPELAPARG